MTQLNKPATIIDEILNGQYRSIASNESATLGAELIDGTGWTLGAGWTGDHATGFVHAIGNTENLSRAMVATGTKLFQVEFTVNSPTSNWLIQVKIGNSVPYDLYTGAGVTKVYKAGIKSVSDGDLVFIPDTSFDGTITLTSVKEITTASLPVQNVKDSTNSNVVESRFSLASLNNIFNGLNAGKYNTSGFSNLAIGSNAMAINTSGFYNVALGSSALQANTVGSRNVAIGFNALVRNICGLRNQAIGSFALQNNTSGNQNIALGSDSLDHNTSGSGNIAIGFSSGYANSTGNYNVSIGNNSNPANTTGSNVVAIGKDAKAAGTTGDDIIAIGQSAAMKSTGNNNVAIGANALYQNTTGSSNVAIGGGAGEGGAAGAYIGNTLVGYFSGHALRAAGNYNTLLGYTAGDTITTGQQNIIIGFDTDTPTATTSYHLNIGNTLYGNLSTKKIGVNVVAPTAYLHLPASTAAADTASMKITAGVLATVAVSGNIESDGTHLYWTDSTGTRKQLDN